MNPRTTGILLLVAAALGAFVWLYELGGEEGRRDAEERAKRLFRGLEAEDVAWIELRTSDGADARLERADVGWRLVAPLEFPADPAAERMAEELVAVVHEAEIDAPQPAAEYGLDDASARVVRFGADGETHELRLGAQTPIGANVYARTSEPRPVYTVASFRTQAFEHALLDLRHARLNDFDTTAVRGVEASWPGGRVVLARDAAAAPPEADDAEGEGADAPAADAASWRLVSPLAVRADDEAVDRLLTSLAFLRADAFADAPTPEQAALFDPPDFAATLEREGAEPLHFALSRPDAEGHRWARGARETLYRVPAERIDDFPRRTVAYRWRQLADFAAPDAQQVDFFFQPAEGGDPVVITGERGDTGWTSRPETFAAGKLSSVVSDLARLEAHDVVAESMGPDELAALGLSPPATVITVLGERDEAGEGEGDDAARPVLAELHLGRVTPQGVVARRAGAPEVWRLGLDATTRIPVSLEAFRTRFRAEAPPAEAPSPEPASPDPLDPTEESP